MVFCRPQSPGKRIEYTSDVEVLAALCDCAIDVRLDSGTQCFGLGGSKHGQVCSTFLKENIDS